MSHDLRTHKSTKMCLVILLEVDMGKDLSYGLFLAGLASGKHSWAATIPKPGDRHSELCMRFSARLKHVDGPG